MGRNPLPEDELKQTVNLKMAPKSHKRLKLICARQSVHLGRKFSQASLIEGKVDKTPLPRRPTDEQLKAYNDANPRSQLTPEDLDP